MRSRPILSRCTNILAKLNRAKRYFVNTERFRFLLSYTGGDSNYCKKLARQIEAVTVYIQKKDARKFYKQCIHENRKFGVFKNTNYHGYFKRDYPPETLLPLLNTLGESTQKLRYINNFRIVCFTGRNFKHAWMHANALFALRIDRGITLHFIKIIIQYKRIERSTPVLSNNFYRPMIHKNTLP